MKPLNPITSSLLIGFSYGIYRVVGSAAQAMVNIASFYAGTELARRLDIGSSDLVASIKELNEALRLAEKVEVEYENGILLLTVKKCNVCPKRVGGYDIKGTACPIPGLIIGFLTELYKVKVDPKTISRNVQWGIGEECRFKIPLKLR